MIEGLGLQTLRNDEEFSLTAHRVNHMNHHNIYLFGDVFPKRSDGEPFRAMPLVFTKVESIYRMDSDPMCNITDKQAQELMDSLWKCGIKPTAGVGSAGAMDAVQKHLEDMRKLVFEK